jgi:hypothetical protein
MMPVLGSYIPSRRQARNSAHIAAHLPGTCTRKLLHICSGTLAATTLRLPCPGAGILSAVCMHRPSGWQPALPRQTHPGGNTNIIALPCKCILQCNFKATAPSISWHQPRSSRWRCSRTMECCLYTGILHVDGAVQKIDAPRNTRLPPAPEISASLPCRLHAVLRHVGPAVQQLAVHRHVRCLVTLAVCTFCRCWLDAVLAHVRCAIHASSTLAVLPPLVTSAFLAASGF